jgi:hypothetical protein
MRRREPFDAKRLKPAHERGDGLVIIPENLSMTTPKASDTKNPKTGATTA